MDTPSLPLAWLLNNNRNTRGQVYTDIQAQPAELAANENILNYIFANGLTGVSTKTRLLLTVMGFGTVGSVTLQNALTSVSLTPSATPNANQFFNASGGTSVIDRTLVAESIAYELRNNPTFSVLYNVFAQGATVIIEAREANTNLNFDIGVLTAGLTLGQVTLSSYTAGTDAYDFSTLIDPSYFVEVYVANGVIGEQVDKRNSILADTLQLPAYATPTWAIDVSDSVKPYTEPVLPVKIAVPAVLVNMLDKRFDTLGNAQLPIVRPYYIVWGISHRYAVGLEKKQQIIGVSDIRYQMNAAFGHLTPYDLTPYVLDTTSTVPVKFLTSAPKRKVTTLTAHEYIHFYRRKNTFELGNFGIEVTFQFTDGTDQINSYPIGAYTGVDGTCSVDISPNVLNIPNVELVSGKEVASYDVRLYWTISSTARFYSEVRSYELFRECGSETANLLFLNEFGVFDSLNFTGAKATTYDRNAETFARGIDIRKAVTGFLSPSDEINVTASLQVKKLLTLTSPSLEKDAYEWVAKILNATSLYLWDEISNAYVSVILTGYSYDYSTVTDSNVLTVTLTGTDQNNISR